MKWRKDLSRWWDDFYYDHQLIIEMIILAIGIAWIIYFVCVIPTEVV